jgi:hypothetical protein
MLPSMSEIPEIMGAGLTGRRQIVRDVELPVDEDGYEIPVESKAMPSPCIRTMQIGCDCPVDCPGRQRDGSCLADIVRRANQHGIDWMFEVSHQGERLWWDYSGPPIPKEK